MIAAITDGGSSAGLMNYLAGPGRANEHSNPHLVAGSSVIMRRWGAWDELSPAQAYEIARWVDQFMVENKVRPVGDKRVFNQETGRRESLKDGKANHVWHCSLSLHPDEGPLGDEVWQAIANDFMDQMGFTGADGKAECRWVAINHGSAKNGGDHIHIMANIVRADGTKWSRWQDQPRVQRACNALEHRYGLRIIEAREHARGARADSAADLRASERQGRRRTNRVELRTRVRAAATSATSELDFLLRLRELGVKARPRFAPGRTDVVTGYWVGLARAGQRTQWYGGGKLARDLTLPRLRARWPDTPHSAQQAVDAWRQAWRGTPDRGQDLTVSSAQWKARAAALESYREALGGIDPMDPVALADATTDLAGLLAASAVRYDQDSPEFDMLERASRAVGRHAQTKMRPARPRAVDDAVVLAAGLASTAAMRPGFSGGVMVALSSLRAVDALADLYEQARQTNSAQDMLRDTAGIFARLHSGLPELEALAYDRMIAMGNADAVQDGGRLAAQGAQASSSAGLAEGSGGPRPGQATGDGRSGGEISPEEFSRIRRISALSMPARPAGPAGRDGESGAAEQSQAARQARQSDVRAQPTFRA